MGSSGLLHSQIGYDIKDPMRALVRSSKEDFLSEKDMFEVFDATSGKTIMEGTPKLWGELWGIYWWEIDFSGIETPGIYEIKVKSGNKMIVKSDSFKVGYNILWEETIHDVAIEQFEVRASQARYNKGWRDCGGASVREVSSHAPAIIGMCDLLTIGFLWMKSDDVRRLADQIVQGCDYLASCQDNAARLGLPEGSLVHEIPHHNSIIPADVMQSVVALAYASRILFEIYPEKSDEYLNRAQSAYDYVIEKARPFGSAGFSFSNHGAAEDFKVPDEWMTRDLLMMMWGGIQLYKSAKHQYKNEVIRLARMVIKRQVSENEKEDGLYGHFFTFDNCGFTEKSNVHHGIGHDTGAIFPHYIIPLLEMTNMWKDHEDMPLWEKTIENFAYGYFLPACSRNPFFLLPTGCFGAEGLLVFAGPWHGTNASIAFAAAMATRFEGHFGDRRFRNITVGNLQWIAGLNAGITRESFDGCVVWKDDIKTGEAVPYSQICGIGGKSVGCWTNIKGTIPNGFNVNHQFQFDVCPSRETDGPWLYTDEDWIPHSGGWMSALAYLRDLKIFA